MKALACTLAAVAILGGDDFAEGLRAYEDARFEDSLVAFTNAERTRGNAAPAELLFNRGLAALRAGELRIAEICAEKAAARGGQRFRGLRDFLLGNAAFERCLRSQQEASLIEADPTAFDQAILNAKRAIGFWRLAVVHRGTWPEAARNVERAARKLDELHAQRGEAEKKRQAKKAKAPQRRPDDPKNPERSEESERGPDPQQEPGTLKPEQIASLLAKLDEKEREKRELRRAQRLIRSAGVEKDW